jgi:hypothetical protein
MAVSHFDETVDDDLTFMYHTIQGWPNNTKKDLCSVKPTASTSTEGIEDTDDDVLWIQWPASDESEAVGHGDASDRSIDRSIDRFGSIDLDRSKKLIDGCWLRVDGRMREFKNNVGNCVLLKFLFFAFDAISRDKNQCMNKKYVFQYPYSIYYI